MIGVLLVTHGNFCESIKESTEMVLGLQKIFILSRWTRGMI